MEVAFAESVIWVPLTMAATVVPWAMPGPLMGWPTTRP